MVIKISKRTRTYSWRLTTTYGKAFCRLSDTVKDKGCVLGVYGYKSNLSTKKTPKILQLEGNQLGQMRSSLSWYLEKTWMWKTFRSIWVKHYGSNDTLPPYITTPILSPGDQNHLGIIGKVLFRHLKEQKYLTWRCLELCWVLNGLVICCHGTTTLTSHLTRLLPG